MEKDNNNHDTLIAKAFSGNASPEELKQLEEWKAGSEENRRIYEKCLKLWQTSPFWISQKTVDDDYTRISFRILRDIASRRTPGILSLIYKAAAILLLPVLIAFGWYYLKSSQNDRPLQYTEIAAPEGQISKCTLADGTEVWLNSGTTIRYDNRYNDRYRDVTLDGEAYFKVSGDKGRPFRVQAGVVQVRALGTSFNVSVHKNSRTVETILEEGSVQIIPNEREGRPVLIGPGERAVYDAGKQKIGIEKVDTELYTAWHEGKFLFKDAALSDIFRKLERVYNVTIEFEDTTIGRIRLRGIFEYNHNIVDALFKIRMTTGLNYRIQGRTVSISYDKNNKHG
ncbi:MAG: FecR domain-containing protein [Mangrovibacterium sp.]|nr:FecR domain-containing protein [Mangrovibacterium sp.]